MKKEPDGFKIIENDDRYDEAIYAMNDNTILLHKQIKELREMIEKEKAGD